MTSKQAVIKLYKNRGETPLECLNRFKNDNPEYKKEKMTYAGRLDPLAEGLLLVLVGEECKNKEKYLSFDKEYEVDVLFGFATDTYDVLGIVARDRKNKGLSLRRRTVTGKGEFLVFSELELHDILQSFVGKFSQKYPPFSSKTIKGKTLFSLFKSGELKDEEIPEKEVEIKNIELLGKRTMSKDDLKKYIKDSIASVKGDFRQNEILNEWNKVMARPNLANLHVISIKVTCTSGTYMRSLANSIGEKVGVPSLALKIKRTKLSNF